MRKLSKKQEKMCVDYLKNGGSPYNINNERGFNLLIELEKVNDYELLYQDVERFLIDYKFEEKNYNKQYNMYN